MGGGGGRLVGGGLWGGKSLGSGCRCRHVGEEEGVVSKKVITAFR